jgi:hypothetical protein
MNGTARPSSITIASKFVAFGMATWAFNGKAWERTIN